MSTQPEHHDMMVEEDMHRLQLEDFRLYQGGSGIVTYQGGGAGINNYYDSTMTTGISQTYPLQRQQDGQQSLLSVAAADDDDDDVHGFIWIW